MDHGGEAPIPATVDSIDLGMAGAAQAGQGGEGEAHAHVLSQLGAPAVRRGSFNDVEPRAAHRNSAEFARQVRTAVRRGQLPVAVSAGELRPHVLYANVGEFGRQRGPGEEPLVDLLFGVHAAYDNYRHYAQQRRPSAGRAGMIVPDGTATAYGNYGYYVLPPRPGGERGEARVPDGAGAAYGYYNYYVMLLRPGAGRGEVLPDGVRLAVYSNYGDFAGSGRAVGTAGALRDANRGAVHYSSGGSAGDLGTPGALAEHLRRLLPLAAIVFFSMAVNGLAAGPGSMAAAFDSFSLFLGGMFLFILHMLRA